MTIRPFNISDLASFLPNEFSNPDVVLDQLTDPAYVTETMWGKRDFVQAIMCYRNYWGRCWSGFFLVADNIEKRTPLRLKSHIIETMELKNALRLQTDSQANECLRKWHEWLGFKHEGTREKLLFDRDYDMWARMRQEA